MRRILLSTILVVSVLGCSQSGKDSSKSNSDAERIQGEWLLESASDRGETLSGDKLGPMKDAKFVFTSTTVTVKGEGDDKPSKYTIDASKDPKEIDIVEEKKTPGSGSSSASTREETVKGIYVLDGDTLKICTARNPEDARPKELTSTKENKNMLLVMKRSK